MTCRIYRSSLKRPGIIINPSQKWSVVIVYRSSIDSRSKTIRRLYEFSRQTRADTNISQFKKLAVHKFVKNFLLVFGYLVEHMYRIYE